MNKVLVIGSGGRCDAICMKLKESEKIDFLFAAPGNPGMARYAILVPIAVDDVDGLVNFALKEKIDLTIVGPEASLALGIVDEFNKHGLKIFGPTKKATMVESSKAYAKDIMKKYNIPTASYEVFSDYDSAINYVKSNNTYPLVLKYDGLALGKGVVIVNNFEEAKVTLNDMLVAHEFGKSSVVIEEYLVGKEFSFMCFVNKENVYKMIPAQDHKRAFDNDLGPNTGGMGAYTRLKFLTNEDINYSYEEIMVKMAKALVKENNPFTGILYGGLMKTKDGIKVIEFNARFGDPETEVVLPCLKSDLYQAIIDILNDKEPELIWDNRPTLGVVLASKGYPKTYQKNFEIFIPPFENGYVFHMGTKINDDKLYTNGGRVLMVVNQGYTLEEAKNLTYDMVDAIECTNLFYRKDIGKDSL